MDELLNNAARRAREYLRGLDDRRVYPDSGALEDLEHLSGPLPEGPSAPDEILELLSQYGAPATVATAGPRYFGFVIGGVLPAALAANWLAGAWDQNAGIYAMSPTAAVLEETALRWLIELLGLPKGTAAGFVTGATMASFTGLAAARYRLLKEKGWDVTTQGLYGAPEIRVVVGEEVHVSLLKALSLLGFGSARVVRVPVDGQGRMRADAVPDLDDLTILCLQAGNVNSGAFDPLDEIVPRAQAAGAWVHVDAAFGLWALASPKYTHLARGLERVDSIGTDAHKWLNVPYDSGIAFCRHTEALGGAMAASPAAYLDMMASPRREPDHFTPEMSRRGRGIEVWAALRSLGKSGIAELVERSCRLARRFADGLRAAGMTVHNEVVLNQVVVSFGDADRTLAVIRQVQAEGTMWAGSTIWKGTTAMRISVSNWSTTEADVDRSLAAIVAAVSRMGE